MWRLLCIQGLFRGRTFELASDRVVIGRDKRCSVILDGDDCVAQEQAELQLCNGGYVFRDIDAGCPSVLNGQRVDAMAVLSAGDLLQVGDSVFRVEGPDSRQQPEGSLPQMADRCAGRDSRLGLGSSAQAYRGPVDNRAATWPRAVLGVTLVLLTVLGVCVVGMREAEERRERRAAVRLGGEAVAALRSINSALTVGVREEEYHRKVVESQTDIDAYRARVADTELAGLGRRLQDAQEVYTDAATIWNHKVTREYGDFINPGTELYELCQGKYPEMMEQIRAGGALYNDKLCSEVAMQWLWERASLLAEKLPTPTEME